MTSLHAKITGPRSLAGSVSGGALTTLGSERTVPGRRDAGRFAGIVVGLAEAGAKGLRAAYDMSCEPDAIRREIDGIKGAHNPDDLPGSPSRGAAKGLLQ